MLSGAEIDNYIRELWYGQGSEGKMYSAPPVLAARQILTPSMICFVLCPPSIFNWGTNVTGSAGDTEEMVKGMCGKDSGALLVVVPFGSGVHLLLVNGGGSLAMSWVWWQRPVPDIQETTHGFKLCLNCVET